MAAPVSDTGTHVSGVPSSTSVPENRRRSKPKAGLRHSLTFNNTTGFTPMLVAAPAYQHTAKPAGCRARCKKRVRIRRAAPPQLSCEASSGPGGTGLPGIGAEISMARRPGIGSAIPPALVGDCPIPSRGEEACMRSRTRRHAQPPPSTAIAVHRSKAGEPWRR